MISPAMTTDTTSGDIAGRAADAIADGLTSHGFDVRMPGQPGGMFLQVTNVRGSLCELTIFGCGVFAWEYRRLDGSQPDHPALPGRGTVCIDDDGLICWRGQIPGPEQPEDGLDLGELTRTLASALTVTTQAPRQGFTAVRPEDRDHN